MKEQSLLYFEHPDQFQSFIYELDILNGWKIQQGLLNDRGKKIYNKPYVKYLREQFDSRDFFRKKVSIAEIVSWLDNMSIMKRLFESLHKSTTRIQYQSIEIFVEYMIEMSKKMRIDYVLKYKDRLLLIEFRTVSNFEKIRSTWQRKIQEQLIYKELMSYYLEDKTILIYSMISMFEYNKNNPNTKQLQYNDNQVDHLTRYIIRYLINENSE